MGKIYVGEWNKAELIPKDRNIYIVGEKIEGIESIERISYFTKFKWSCYKCNIKVGVRDKIIIKIRQHDICWIECNICVEDATEITKEDLSIINDIVLFLKTKAEESKKQWDAEYAENKNQV